MSLSTQAGLEEERRLFYVALTRARKQLTIYVPLRYQYRPRGRDGLHSYAQPSRFLCPSVRRHLDTVYAEHLEIAPATHCETATASVSMHCGPEQRKGAVLRPETAPLISAS